MVLGWLLMDGSFRGSLLRQVGWKMERQESLLISPNGSFFSESQPGRNGAHELRTGQERDSHIQLGLTGLYLKMQMIQELGPG